MIWFIIGCIVAIVIIVRICIDDSNDLFDKNLFSILTIVASLEVSSLVLVMTSAIVSNCADIDYAKETDTQIIALKDNQNISGGFYIMGGYIDEELYYYYATETELGYKTEKISSDNAYIKYTKGQAHIETYFGDFHNSFLHTFAIPLVDNRYIIYCPEGTITTEYIVDLE
jgi:hypothetical protein